MNDAVHTYPSLYPPGSNWALDEAWHILDTVKPGVLSGDVRAFLAGLIAGTLIRVASHHDSHHDEGRNAP